MKAKKSTAGGLDGRAWNEIKALPLPWFSGLSILLELVETSGVWPQGLLDSCIAMIPKADGDSTPPRSTAPQCAPRLCTGCGLPFGLDISGSGLKGGCLNQYLVLVMVYLWFSTALDEVCHGFAAGVWEAELLVVQFLVGFIGLVRVMMLMFIVLSTLFIPLFLPCFFSVDVLSLWQMFLRVSGVRGSLRLSGMLF